MHAFKGDLHVISKCEGYMMSELRYIFVHGAGGWGSYDAIDRVLPYWGMFTGSLMKKLRARGFACFAASTSPSGSAWVRACELYAQLAGRKTDYGKAYSQKEGIPRFGKDFSDKPLIPEWNDETKLVLLGHSMGGAAVRMLGHLLEYGSEEERAAADPSELSDLFKGGMGNRVHAIVTMASPSSGASSLDLLSDPQFDVSSVPSSFGAKAALKVLSLRINTGKKKAYHEHFSMIDRAMEQNEQIATLKNVYYFAVPCCCTYRTADGRCVPDPEKTEIIFMKRGAELGAYQGITPGGIEITEEWQDNDGLVNTVSEKAPFGAPHKEFERSRIEKGIWQVMPVIEGDHMSVQGGLFIKRDMTHYYVNLLQMIRLLP